MQNYFDGKVVREVKSGVDIPEEFRDVVITAGSWGYVSCKFEDMVRIPVHPNDKNEKSCKEALGFSDKEWDDLTASVPSLNNFIEKAVEERDKQKQSVK